MLVVCSIRDAKADFHQPFFVKTKGEALRGLMDILSDPNSNIHKYPEDFALFYLGTFDELTGSFALLPQPEHLHNAIDLRKDA